MSLSFGYACASGCGTMSCRASSAIAWLAKPTRTESETFRLGRWVDLSILRWLSHSTFSTRWHVFKKKHGECDIQNTRFNMIPQPPSYQRYQCYQRQEWFYKAAAEQLKSRPNGLVVIAICCHTPSIHGSLTNMYHQKSPRHQMSPVEIATPWIDRVDWIGWHLAGNAEMFHTSNTNKSIEYPKIGWIPHDFPFFLDFLGVVGPPIPLPSSHGASWRAGSAWWTRTQRSGRHWCGATSCDQWSRGSTRKPRIRPRRAASWDDGGCTWASWIELHI